jgi:hypothetical protein
MTDPIDPPFILPQAAGKRRRRPSLARILKTAKKEGCDRVVIDGHIVIMLGPATAESGGGDIVNNGSHESEWDVPPAGAGRLGR